MLEETGMILPLGTWVIAEAARQGQVWQARYPGHPPLRICVNLSAKALCVLTYWPGGDWPVPAPDPVRAEPALTDLAGVIRLAPSLPDQRTWFDAEVALPR